MFILRPCRMSDLSSVERIAADILMDMATKPRLEDAFQPREPRLLLDLNHEVCDQSCGVQLDERQV